MDRRPVILAATGIERVCNRAPRGEHLFRSDDGVFNEPVERVDKVIAESRKLG
jgi:hypothetical protein